MTKVRFGTTLENSVAASILQASDFCSDVTVFRLNARPRPRTGSKPAFRRNTAERVYTIEAAHNPEVAGSNPAPAMNHLKNPANRRVFLLSWLCGAMNPRPSSYP